MLSGIALLFIFLHLISGLLFIAVTSLFVAIFLGLQKLKDVNIFLETLIQSEPNHWAELEGADLLSFEADVSNRSKQTFYSLIIYSWVVC